MELVDREKLIAQYSANPETKGFMELVQDDCVVEALKKAEVVEAAPVVHAKWIYEDSEHICSNCRSAILYELDNQGDAICEEWPWCAKCGAKMDLEDK